MTKLSKKNLDPKDMGKYINNLWNALTLMGSKEEVRLLVKDLFTHTEYKMFAKRLDIARRLLNGQTYEEIKAALNVTERPIVYMSNILANGGQGIKNADLKLQSVDKANLKKINERQDYLERRKRRKLPVETVAFDLAKAGISATGRILSSKYKKSTVKKHLEI